MKLFKKVDKKIAEVSQVRGISVSELQLVSGGTLNPQPLPPAEERIFVRPPVCGGR